jgi:hypothetical protein
MAGANDIADERCEGRRVVGNGVALPSWPQAALKSEAAPGWARRRA